MNIISHRGYWLKSHEKNTKTAFQRSFEHGFGTETDIRDACGTLVISHDMPDGTEMTLESFLKIPRPSHLPLAFNIKSDGLAKHLVDTCMKFNLNNWFVFDASVPDMRQHIKAGCRVFTRMSEEERHPSWLDQAHGIWLDSFGTEWFDERLITDLLNREKQIAIVSPELHGRDPQRLWEMLMSFHRESCVVLCTDYPEQARNYFGGAND